MKKNEAQKLKLKPSEKIQELPFKKTLKGYRYAATSQGRIIRYKTKPEEGEFLKEYAVSANYPGVFIMANGKRMNALVHRLVAMAFLPKPPKNQTFVIHKDRNKNNNSYTNLKWVTREEHLEHAMAGDSWKAAYRQPGRYKLTEGVVKEIKKKIKDGQTISALSKKYKVTEMQLYRIRSGENWGWVK